MLRTDTGNFNRFLTSLGLVLLGAALVIPYFYFRNTSTLSLPEADLRKMTDTGRSALEARQDGIVALEPWVIALVALLAVLGVALLITGGFRLRSAQESDDEETELRKRRARLEVAEMSPGEQDQRAAEKVEDEEKEVVATPASPEPASAGATTFLDDTVSIRAAAQRVSRTEHVRRVEQRIEEVFRSGELTGYTFKSQLRIGSAAGEVRMDGLFEATDGRPPDVVLQIWVPMSAMSVRRLARNRADELIATLGRYSALTSRHGFGWLVMVIPDEDSDISVSPEEAARVVSNSLKPLGEAVMLRESELSLLPEMFRRRFGPS